jgi:nitrate/TMAO reductase-like tetraheme cytochrome c subunit
MIAVVMESEMKDQSKWKGSVSAILCGHIWVDYTSEDKFEECRNKLAEEIKSKMTSNM